MENQDSEPLFGDDVYRLLRDDSLLHRTGSNNFAALLDSTDTYVPENPIAQQQQQQVQVHQEQQMKEEYWPQQQKEEQQGNQKEEQQGNQIKEEQQKKDNQQLDQETQQQHQQVVKQAKGYQIQGNQQQQQCYIYRVPYAQNGTTSEVVLLSSNGAIAELNCPSSSGNQEQTQVQPQQQQPAVSWDEIDVDNEDVVQSSNVNVISNSSFMALMEESASSLLPDTTSHTVPSLQPWAGKYNFNISIPTDNKDRNKWCFNQELKKLYVCPNVAVPVNILMSNWIDATITITPVYQQSQHRMEPVNRCYNCKYTKNCDADLADYIIQVEGEGSDYEISQERHIVKVPLQSPPPGEVASTLLLKLMCLTSCVGGPNRRPFCLVLTLRCNVTGVQIGRQILDVKCCKCPSRDMTNDARVTNGNTNSAARTTDEKLTKVRKLASELQVGQKRKKPKIKPEPGVETRYVNIAVPVEFELQVKRYVNGLIAEQILRRNQPNLLLYPEEDN